MPLEPRCLLRCFSTLWILSGVCGLKLQQVRGLEGSGEASSTVKPDYTLYRPKNELLLQVKKVVRASSVMQVETQRATDGNYTANVMVVTVDYGGIETEDIPKAKLLLDFGEHGREFVSSELGLRFLQVLSNSTLLEDIMGSKQAADKMTTILQHSVLKVIPMENENGRAIVEKGDVCYRKNGRGVDPNRNWGIDWGKKEKDYAEYEEYPGTRPFSEPEVQIVLNLTKQLQPHVWLNVHSGMEALFTPFDHKASIPEGKENEATIAMMKDINSMLFKDRCAVGSGGKSVGYLAHGTATDYMYLGLNVPISLTWEIYGDSKANFHDCFRMFNPLTAKDLEVVLRSWVRAIFRLLELLPSHPSTSFLAEELEVGSGQDTSEKAEVTSAGGDKPHSQPQPGATAAGQDPAHATPRHSTPGSSRAGSTKPTPTHAKAATASATTTASDSDNAEDRESAEPSSSTDTQAASGSQKISDSRSSSTGTPTHARATPNSGKASGGTTASANSTSGSSGTSGDNNSGTASGSSGSSGSSSTGGTDSSSDINADTHTSGGAGSRREGPSDIVVIMTDSATHQSQLLQGAKLAGVWTLTVALVGLVGVLAMAARYGRQARKRPQLYRPLAP